MSGSTTIKDIFLYNAQKRRIKMAVPANVLNINNLTMNINPIYTIGRLTTYQGRTVCEIVIDFSKVVTEKATYGAFSGFGVGTICHIGYIAFRILALKDMSVVWSEAAKVTTQEALKTAGKEIAVLTVKEVAKETGKYAIQGAVTGALVQSLEGAYDAAAHEYQFYISLNKCTRFGQSIAAAGDIVGEFLNDPLFIDPNSVHDICCPISQRIITYPVKTPCNHYFEFSEIVNWLQQGHPTCPNCRGPINGIANLDFSWEIHLRIVKVIRAIMHRVNSNNPLLLPTNLQATPIAQLKNLLSAVDNDSKNQVALLERHIVAALDNAAQQQQLTPQQHHQYRSEFDNWKDNF